MAHRWRPSSTLTWNRLRRSYRLGAVWPRRRCCSTEAGSVSPCTTSSRRRSARYSPGTSCQAGWPLCWPKPTRGPGCARTGRCPTGSRPWAPGRSSPSRPGRCHRGPQVHRGSGSGRAELRPPVQELRLPRLERALQLAVGGQAHVVGDALAVVDGGHGGLRPERAEAIWCGRGGRCHPFCRSRRGRCRSGAARPAGRRRWGRWKIQFCQADSRPKILVARLRPGSAVGLQPGQRIGGEAGPLLEGEPQLVVPIEVVRHLVTRPSPAARGRRPGTARPPAARPGRPGFRRTARPGGWPAGGRQRPEAELVQAEHVRGLGHPGR